MRGAQTRRTGQLELPLLPSSTQTPNSLPRLDAFQEEDRIDVLVVCLYLASSESVPDPICAERSQRTGETERADLSPPPPFLLLPLLLPGLRTSPGLRSEVQTPATTITDDDSDVELISHFQSSKSKPARGGGRGGSQAPPAAASRKVAGNKRKNCQLMNLVYSESVFGGF